MGIDFKQHHEVAMRKLRQLFPKNVKIIYTDNQQFSVPCTFSNEDVKNIYYDKYVGENILNVNILISDLKRINAPIKGFLYVVKDRIKYQVESSISNGIFDDVVQLQCKIFKGSND